mmetsp:Transcript_80709/g.237183  ORF Transcript_80709/g.237183 Transcript_80709/m.237183 type:complete len:244 (+) Transcript_80709:1517-2248(+)
MRTTCSRALSAARRLSCRARLMCICSRMSGRDFSNSRRYAQAEGLELQVLCRTSLTIRSLASFNDMSVSTIVSDSVMHSVISMAQSLLSRQNTMASRMRLRELVTPRSNCSRRSQSLSLSRLPPAKPFLSRSRFCRSCVALSSRRCRSRSSSMSACVQVDIMTLGWTTPDRATGFAVVAGVMGTGAGRAGGGGAEEKFVLLFLSDSTSQSGGRHQAPPSDIWNISDRHTLKLSPCAKAKVLQR